jgi:glycoprotein 6-alpha-L-fucosyltransferase
MRILIRHGLLFIVILLCVWMVLLLFLLSNETSQGRQSDADDVQEIFAKRVENVLSDVEQLRTQNEHLKKLLLDNSKTIEEGLEAMDNSFVPQIPAPSRTEQWMTERMAQIIRSQRTIQASIETLFFLYKEQSANIINGSTLEERIQAAENMLALGAEVVQFLQSQTHKLTAHDDMRKQKLRNLSAVVETRLHNLQHPKNCANRQKLICKLNKICGFACQIHHVVYCLIVAYATNRTMLLDDRKWRYTQKGWTSVFQPVSSCTLDPVDLLLARKWSGSKDVSSADIITLPIIDEIERYLPYLPQSFPADLASDLMFAHSYPPAWWIGQLAKYLMKPSDGLLAHLAGEEKRLVLPNWRPLVGVHVRRTDKVPAEASSHPLSEYMGWVDHYFKVQRFINPELTYKPVYIATDEGRVIEEAYDKWSSYFIVLSCASFF